MKTRRPRRYKLWIKVGTMAAGHYLCERRKPEMGEILTLWVIGDPGAKPFTVLVDGFREISGEKLYLAARF